MQGSWVELNAIMSFAVILRAYTTVVSCLSIHHGTVNHGSSCMILHYNKGSFTWTFYWVKLDLASYFLLSNDFEDC